MGRWRSSRTNWRLSVPEIFKVYMRADRLLKGTQDLEDTTRLPVCARVAIKRLSGMQLHDKSCSFYSAVRELKAKLIEQALEEAGGSVVRAPRLLGLKHQTFTSMLQARHQKLLDKRTPREKRLRSIIKEPEEYEGGGTFKFGSAALKVRLGLCVRLSLTSVKRWAALSGRRPGRSPKNTRAAAPQPRAAHTIPPPDFFARYFRRIPVEVD